jgi:16S rRNA A1518/A1519 N6-dimethyltransferase RsmA/KsgA/DIM1 with predicted DNA glycosylase/AP lyase activity
LKSIPNEQHFLRSFGEFETLLDGCSLAGRNVLEIGVGDGAVTRLLTKRGARVLGYEIDPGVLPAEIEGAEFRVADATQEDLSFLTSDWACVSVPPYELLPWLLKTLDERGIADAVVMASRKKASMLEDAGFRYAFTLDGSAFEPASTGEHHVLIRGFGG